MGQFSSLYCLIFSFVLALSAVTTARAQQGQYHVNYVPFELANFNPAGGLATYAPIREVDGETLSLRSDDGTVYTFTLDAKTVFCHGATKESDWSFLKKVRRKDSITVLTNDGTGTTALVVWDRPPSLSMSKGSFVFALPEMCK